MVVVVVVGVEVTVTVDGAVVPLEPHATAASTTSAEKDANNKPLRVFTTDMINY
ncbi:hypothetical protein MHEL_24660 [Mycolicibacterium helvum]|uniref:Uncharacterized protein n=1 Tax=Mycolicibacterium helvum TaxID=1534349 RepID=A0A7I7T603_9MYCO|nr:hypothetical protein MHEL_24660 [Mycolicibacterium helvum]